MLASVLATGVIGCVADLSEVEQGVKIEDELKPLRAAFARYNDFNNAVADGYLLGYMGAAAGCVAHPTRGAMGYHYFNYARMADPTIDEMAPEALVYHTRDGELKLGSVEWVVHKLDWEAAGNVGAPEVHGHTMTVINPVLNWYVGHAWIFVANPSGIFSDWNPDVHCP
jgi:hypothetical protein